MAVPVIGSSTAPARRACAASDRTSRAGTGRWLIRRRSVRRRSIAGNRAASSASAGPGRIRTVARWPRSSGSGRRSTSTPEPAAASATRRWCNAAPQLTTRSRRSGSVAMRWRFQSACSSTRSGAIRHRQGWVLCTDGARSACWTAAGMSTIRFMVLPPMRDLRARRRPQHRRRRRSTARGVGPGGEVLCPGRQRWNGVAGARVMRVAGRWHWVMSPEAGWPGDGTRSSGRTRQGCRPGRRWTQHGPVPASVVTRPTVAGLQAG